MIPPWRHSKLTSHVKVQKGTHEERHQPSQTATVTEVLGIYFFFNPSIGKNTPHHITELHTDEVYPLSFIKLRAGQLLSSQPKQRHDRNSHLQYDLALQEGGI